MNFYEQELSTDVIIRQIGELELTHQSALLLNEIIDISLPLQSILLKFLEEIDTDKIDICGIATTDKDIDEEIRVGHFGTDLFHGLYII